MLPNGLSVSTKVISGIQSFIPSDEHIIKHSTLHVKSISDLKNPRLGVSDQNAICGTCGLTYQHCAGHHGHLNVAMPIFRVLYLNRLQQILSHVCFFCQRLKYKDDTVIMAELAHVAPKDRLTFLSNISKSSKFTLCGQVHYCVEDMDDVKCQTMTETQPIPSIRNSDTPSESQRQDKSISKKSRKRKRAPTTQKERKKAHNKIARRKPMKRPSSTMKSIERYGCGNRFIDWEVHSKDALFLRAVVHLTESDWSFTDAELELRITPNMLHTALSMIDKETCEYLGLDNDNHPKSMMWSVIPIPSFNTRPNHQYYNKTMIKNTYENDWTRYLRMIIQCNNRLLNTLEAGGTIDDVSLTTYQYKKKRHALLPLLRPEHLSGMSIAQRQLLKNATQSDTYKQWERLNGTVASFHSYKHKKYSQNGYGKSLINVQERYKHQKHGRFRVNVIARRVNNAGRGVLEGGIHQYIDQIEVPLKLAMQLCKSERVFKLNAERLHMMIINGPFKYPGANFITMLDGSEIDLVYYDNRRDIDISSIAFVKRHLLEGDRIMVNRQPTLHRPSMMSFRVLVREQNALRLHYAVFAPMAADCDGDEVNVYVPQTLEADAELSEICRPQNVIMKDGRVSIKFIQNALLGAYTLTQSGVTLTRRDVFQLLSPIVHCLDAATLDRFRDVDGVYTGLEVFSTLLPDDFSMRIPGHKLTIVRGMVIEGQLTGKVLNAPDGILATMYRDYSNPDITSLFLYQGYLLFQGFLDMFGFSASLRDIVPHHLDRDHINEYTQTFERHINAQPRSTVTESKGDMDELIMRHQTYIKTQVEGLIDASFQRGGATRLKRNGFYSCIVSGAKGTKTNILQIAGFLGQQYISHKRPLMRTSHHAVGSVAEHGFVRRCLAYGLSPLDFIHDMPSSLESIINKNKGTAKSGYTVRKLTTSLLGVVINNKGQVVDSAKNVIWDCYGNDGYDAQNLQWVSIDVRRLCTPDSSSCRINFARYPELSDAQKSQLTQSRDRMLQQEREYVKTLRLRLQCMYRLSYTDASDHTSPMHVKFKSPLSFELMRFQCHHRRHRPCNATTLLDMFDFEYFLFFKAFLAKLHAENLVKRHHYGMHAGLYSLFRFRSSYYNATEECMYKADLVWLTSKIHQRLRRRLVQYGEPVGVLASQCLGEPFTQMSLKMPHFAGRAGGTFSGIQKVSNILNNSYHGNEIQCNLNRSLIKSSAEVTQFGLHMTKFNMNDMDAVAYPTSNYDATSGNVEIRFCIPSSSLLSNGLSSADVVRAINKRLNLDWKHYSRVIRSGHTEFALRLPIISVRAIFFSNSFRKVFTPEQHSRLDPMLIMALTQNLFVNTNINPFGCAENFLGDGKDPHTDEFRIVLYNMDVQRLALHQELNHRTLHNTNSVEVCNMFGIVAARNNIVRELEEVIQNNADARHLELIARVMTQSGTMVGMKSRGVIQTLPPLQRASFEQTTSEIVNYAFNKEVDDLSTICGAVMCNSLIKVGTGFNPCFNDTSTSSPPPLQEALPLDGAIQCDLVASIDYSYPFVLLTFFHDIHNQRFLSLFREDQWFNLPTTGIAPSTLFEGTILVAQLYSQMPTAKGPLNTMIISDCMMVCGNRCATLRYDQRYEIASEVIHKLATQDNLHEPSIIPNSQTLPNAIHPNRPYTALNTIIVDNLPYALHLKSFCTFRDIRHIPLSMLSHGTLRLNVFSVKSSISYRSPCNTLSLDCCASQHKLHVLFGKDSTLGHSTTPLHHRHHISPRFSRYLGTDYIAYAYTHEAETHQYLPLFRILDPFSLFSKFVPLKLGTDASSSSSSSSSSTTVATIATKTTHSLATLCTAQIVWSFIHNAWFLFNIDKIPQFSQCCSVCEVEETLLDIMDNPLFENPFMN